MYLLFSRVCCWLLIASASIYSGFGLPLRHLASYELVSTVLRTALCILVIHNSSIIQSDLCSISQSNLCCASKMQKWNLSLIRFSWLKISFLQFDFAYDKNLEISQLQEKLDSIYLYRSLCTKHLEICKLFKSLYEYCSFNKLSRTQIVFNLNVKLQVDVSLNSSGGNAFKIYFTIEEE